MNCSKSLSDSDWIWDSGLSISYCELSPGFHTAHQPIVADTIDHVDQTMHLLLPASIPLVPLHFFINSTTFCMNILRMKYNVFTIYDKTTIQKKRPTSHTQSVNNVSCYYEKFHQHWVQYICAQHGICCLTYWHSSIVLAFVVQAFIVLVFICHVGIRHAGIRRVGVCHAGIRHAGGISCAGVHHVGVCRVGFCCVGVAVVVGFICHSSVLLVFIRCAGICRVGICRAGIHLLGWHSLVVLAFIRCTGFHHACTCPFVILVFIHCAAACHAGICVHADANAAVHASVVMTRVDSYWSGGRYMETKFEWVKELVINCSVHGTYLPCLCLCTAARYQF